MDTLQFLAAGFSAALTPTNLAFALVGCILGTLIGVLPGLGPAAGTAILIPLTFKLDPTGAIIMLSAIYYGAMYGGTITSVLINVPGEAASVITCIDGYEMAKKGRAGTALGIAAIGSFIGGIVAATALVVVATPLSRLALSFGPPEFFALLLVGLCLVTSLAGRSLVAGVLMTVVGLLIAMIGIDPGARRAALHVRHARSLRRGRLHPGGHGPVRHRRDSHHRRGAGSRKCSRPSSQAFCRAARNGDAHSAPSRAEPASGSSSD